MTDAWSQNALKKEKNAKKEKVAKEEEEKEKIRKALVAASLSRNNKLSADYRSIEEGSGSDSGGISKYLNKLRKVRGGGIGGEWDGLVSLSSSTTGQGLAWSVSSCNSSGTSSMWRMRSAARNGKNVVWTDKRTVNWS
ncbi:hypothetical protein BWQ96_04271 [Gracilariopsis chorda]|uniref:Uncharacterized protein n=1 Tax=Gracilariopsis chorda TaxID=448386 RepID=A0A2V3IUY7_9FLOR|nr:hypothetical protein BWQ96_04271 [Gracilariopsis chorda]|eukprot:PXF45958.1 hypothetical protein BWQ96_04271 [Gracilariopsis chorda]